MKTKLTQIIYDLRHQPVIASVTIFSTTMSIFLIMIVVMMNQEGTTPYAPESCRDRFMLGAYMHFKYDQNEGSGGISYSMARRLYDGLEGIESRSYMQKDCHAADVSGPTGEAFQARSRKADAGFWQVFDHELLEGRFFTPEEADALMKVAVITESMARRLFGTEERVGNTFIFNQERYRVIGVVADHSMLAPSGSFEVLIPTGPKDETLRWGDDWGDVAVAMVRKPGVNAESIRDQVKARYAQIDTEYASKGMKSVYHEQPFDQKMIAVGINGSNMTPDVEGHERMSMLLYAILLFVPAINLSTMLHSRMRRRISEIGVRRAFGCTRARVFLDIIVENFIVTLLGGVFGLVLGIIFVTNCAGLFETMENFGTGATPPLSALVDWSIVVIALILCFVLNLVCAAIPAWQAARENPVNAINAR